MRSEGCAPEQFPFQAFVNSSDYQSYIWLLRQRKSQKTGSQILPKIIHIYPKKRRKMEAIVHVLSSKKMYRHLFIHHLSITWETLLEKICWETTEFHGVTRRIVNLLSNSHGRVFIFCTNQSGLSNSAESILYRQVRHSWVHTGKFAILEFTPASSPFLSSYRQVRHSWVHTGKFAILEFTPASSPILSSHRQVSHYCSHRQDSPSFPVHIGKIRQVWVNIGKIRQVWVNIGKIRQVLS
jgi:hypothetical protein